MRDLSRFLVTVYSWRTLKRIGQSYLSTITIAIPLIGYVIIFSDFTYSLFHSIEARVSGAAVSLDPAGYLVNLKYTYVGLSLIGIATILYRMLCPAEISNYRDDRDYINSSLQIMHEDRAEFLRQAAERPHWYDFVVPFKAKAAEITLENFAANPSAVGRRGPDARMRREDWLERNYNRLTLILEVHFSTQNYSQFFTRSTIALLYVFGFLAAIMPSAKIFLSVSADVISLLKMGRI